MAIHGSLVHWVNANRELIFWCSAVDGGGLWGSRSRGCPRTRRGANQGRFLLLNLRRRDSSLMLSQSAACFSRACCSEVGPGLPRSPRSDTSGVSSILDPISTISNFASPVSLRASSRRQGGVSPRNSGRRQPCPRRTSSCAPGRPSAHPWWGRARSRLRWRRCLPRSMREARSLLSVCATPFAQEAASSCSAKLQISRGAGGLLLGVREQAFAILQTRWKLFKRCSSETPSFFFYFAQLDAQHSVGNDHLWQRALGISRQWLSSSGPTDPVAGLAWFPHVCGACTRRVSSSSSSLT